MQNSSASAWITASSKRTFSMSNWSFWSCL